MRTRSLFVLLTMLGSGLAFSESQIEPKRLDRVIWQYAAIRDTMRIPPSRVLDFVKSNNVEKCVFYEAVTNMVCKSKADVESGVESFSGMHFMRMMHLISATRDRDWIPFLLQTYHESKDSRLKYHILKAYASIAKDESVGLLEKALDDNVVEGRRRFYIWEVIGNQCDSVDEKGKKKISAFLLRQMEMATSESDIDPLERILAAHSKEYKTSKQRMKYAERLLKSPHLKAQDLGKAMMKEIEKVPSAQRADLSDLLRKPADETKGE